MVTMRKLALLAGDVAALYLSLALTLLIRYGAGAFSASWSIHLVPFSTLFLLWILVFYLADLYRPETLRSRAAFLSTLAVAVAIAALLSTVVLYLFTDFFELTPKTNLAIFSAAFLLLSALARALLRQFFAVGALDVAILGNSPLLTRAVRYLKENPQAGYRIEAAVQSPEEKDFAALERKIRARNVQLIVLEPRLARNREVPSAIYRLLPLSVSIVNAWDFYETVFECVAIDELDEGWFIENITTRRPFYEAAKRTLDLTVAAVAGILFLPLMALIAVAIAATSRGPVIFAQERAGKNGKRFTLYKFRIMVAHHDGSPWTARNDPRLTWVGKILNFTHLNELPQLVNILKGDISFTGPRPESVELSRKYEKLPYYDMRHAVKPGLTGWAQIRYRASASVEEAKEKLCYDLYYVKNRSLLFDLLIILKTIRYVFISPR